MVSQIILRARPWGAASSVVQHCDITLRLSQLKWISLKWRSLHCVSYISACQVDSDFYRLNAWGFPTLKQFFNVKSMRCVWSVFNVRWKAIIIVRWHGESGCSRPVSVVSRVTGKPAVAHAQPKAQRKVPGSLLDGSSDRRSVCLKNALMDFCPSWYHLVSLYDYLSKFCIDTLQ